MGIRATTKWIATVVGAVVLIPIAGDFFVELARQKGLYEDPEGDFNALVSAITGLAGYWWYPRLVCLVVGFGGGMWVAWILRGKEVEQRERQKSIAFNLYKASRALDGYCKRFESDPRTQQLYREVEQYVNVVRSLELTMAKLGIRIPNLDFDADPVSYIERMRDFTSRIAPLINEGHITEAKRVAKEMAVGFKTETINPKPMPPSQWPKASDHERL